MASFDPNQQYAKIYEQLARNIQGAEAIGNEATLKLNLDAAKQLLQGRQYTETNGTLLEQARHTVEAMRQNASEKEMRLIEAAEQNVEGFPKFSEIISPPIQPPATGPNVILPKPSVPKPSAPPIGNFASLATKLAPQLLGDAATGGAGLVVTLALSLRKQLQKHSDKLGAVAIGAGLFGFAVPVTLPIAVVAGTGAFVGGGIGAFTSGVGLLAGGVASLLGIALTVAAAPIVATIIALPLLIAFIMVVINSGAYIVPPGDSLLPLVGLQKAGEGGSLGVGGSYPNCWPASGTIKQGPYCSTSSFTHCSYNENAIDIAGVHGSEVHATHDGTVAIGSDPDGWGNFVIVYSKPEVSPAFHTVYGHLLKIIVDNGQSVSAGQTIGLMDGAKTDSNPGTSTGTHLHYEFVDSQNTLINSIVPPYVYNEPTQGCFAEISGGTGTPLEPGTGGPPPVGGQLCATSGGDCTNTCTTSLVPLPDGQTVWSDCSSQGFNFCCQQEEIQTCSSQTYQCTTSAYCDPACVRDFPGCTTGNVCCDPNCSLFRPPAKATCSDYGYCDSSCTTEVSLPTGASGWQDCSATKPHCCEASSIPEG